MSTHIHTTVSRHKLELDRERHDAYRFFERMLILTHDPDVTVAQLVEELYSDQNPVLKPGFIPGRGLITAEVLEDPYYQAMADLQHLKCIQTGVIQLPPRKTISVAETAERLGISETAVRQALGLGRLTGEKIGSRWEVNASSVDAYEVTTRGPSAQLEVWMGAHDGRGLHIRHDGEIEILERDGDVQHARIRGWTRALVKTTVKDPKPGIRVIEIRARRGAHESYEHGDALEVYGRFEITRRENNRTRALELWNAWDTPER